MGGLGFLALGTSAGLFSGFILSKAKGASSVSLLVALLPVLLSGAWVFLAPEFKGARSTDFYPIGLLIAFLWLGAWPFTILIDYPWITKHFPAVVTGAVALITAMAVLRAF